MKKIIKRSNDSKVAKDNTVEFNNVIQIIETAQRETYKIVNTKLIDLYWSIGELVSKKIETDGWGKSTVQELSDFIHQKYPQSFGFSAQNIWKMRQFYESFDYNQKLATLSRELSWSHNVIIMTLKSDEQKEFLNLPEKYSEKQFEQAILDNLKKFMCELGGDLFFVDSQHNLQVAGKDYYVDLLFYHQDLKCYFAIELKVGDFLPKYMSQLDFYLEALDQQTKKDDDNPSIGLLLCMSANETIVEYSLNRTVSPAMIAEYKLKLPDKKFVRKKLIEIANEN
jgi:predicted nuclease of restriction endonuclease-like (RecB) superfamily